MRSRQGLAALSRAPRWCLARPSREGSERTARARRGDREFAARRPRVRREPTASSPRRSRAMLRGDPRGKRAMCFCPLLPGDTRSRSRHTPRAPAAAAAHQDLRCVSPGGDPHGRPQVDAPVVRAAPRSELAARPWRIAASSRLARGPRKPRVPTDDSSSFCSTRIRLTYRSRAIRDTSVRQPSSFRSTLADDGTRTWIHATTACIT